jgi:hypothetical protein
LHQVVVRAGLQAEQLVADLALGREQDEVRRRFAQPVFTDWQSSSPSTSGIIQSETTRSGSNVTIAFIPSRPSDAAVT